MPYEDLVTNTVAFHPLCSSVFINDQWIEALNLPYASALLVMDFRTTASSQVRESTLVRYKKIFYKNIFL